MGTEGSDHWTSPGIEQRTLLDALSAEGWTLQSFNHVGPRSPYVRVAFSIKHWGTVFEPMDHGWPGKDRRVAVRDMLFRRIFKIDYERYSDPEQLGANWIEDQANYPFGQWMRPLSFGFTSCTVSAPDGRTFVMSYGAFIPASGIALRGYWP